jgi:hypothetical protein
MRSYLAATLLLVALPVSAAPLKAKPATARKEFNRLLTAHPNLKVFHEGMLKETGVTFEKRQRAVAAAIGAGELIGLGVRLAHGQADGLTAGQGMIGAIGTGYAISAHRRVVTATREANTLTVKEALWRAKNVSGTYTITPEQLKSWHQAGLIDEIEPEAATR